MQRGGGGQTAYSVFPVENYKFGAKPPRPDKGNSTAARLARIKAKYETEGVRRTVDAVLLVAQHGHPHVLLLQFGGSPYYKLPGGKLKPDEDELSGLRRKLEAYVSPEQEMLRTPWDVGECVGAWLRPSFDSVLYPYAPPHIRRPKESRKLFLVQLPEAGYFGVPKNYSLVAVPLFELHDNATRFGPLLSALPSMLSRLRLTVVGPLPQNAAGKAPSSVAAGAPPGEEYEGVLGQRQSSLATPA